MKIENMIKALEAQGYKCIKEGNVTGHCNSGNSNSGDSNSGNSNSGNWNSGNWNSGDSNSGNWNSGDCNSGDCNSGNWNSGDSNSGNWNSGDSNSGNWNSGDSNSGNFNQYSHAFFFDRPIPTTFKMPYIECLNFSLVEWVEDKYMTDKEKEENPSYKTTGGYLKKKEYKEAFTESIMKAPKKELEQIMKLPNFDSDTFCAISGVDLMAVILSKS